jgi:hypothetical protein
MFKLKSITKYFDLVDLTLCVFLIAFVYFGYGFTVMGSNMMAMAKHNEVMTYNNMTARDQTIIINGFIGGNNITIMGIVVLCAAGLVLCLELIYRKLHYGSLIGNIST